MLNMFRVAALVISILVFCDSYSQQPAPNLAISIPQKQQQSAKQKQNSVTEIKNTEQSPVFVKIAPTQKTKEQIDHEAYEQNEKPALDRWVTGATVFLAAVTAALAFFTYFLWGATRRLVEDSRNALVSTQRAFVYIKNFEVHPFENPNRLSIIPTWENSGETPTKNMFSHVNWQWFLAAIPDDFNFPDLAGEETNRLLIGPKQTITASPLEIKSEWIDRVIDGNGRIYIWGWTDYDDVFKDTARHRTEFCNEVIIIRTKEHEIAARFKLHKTHNGADDECLKKPKAIWS